jgi:hypothetical protein
MDPEDRKQHRELMRNLEEAAEALGMVRDEFRTANLIAYRAALVQARRFDAAAKLGARIEFRLGLDIPTTDV